MRNAQARAEAQDIPTSLLPRYYLVLRIGNNSAFSKARTQTRHNPRHPPRPPGPGADCPAVRGGGGGSWPGGRGAQLRGAGAAGAALGDHGQPE